MPYDPYSTSDDQYRNPTPTAPSGGIEWLPDAPFAGNGRRVCNEADPSWEEVVTMVVIPGHPDMIRDASGAWQVLFSRVEQARSLVDQVNSNLASWQGASAESYKGHIAGVSQGLSHLVDQHRPVVQQLNSAADNLQTTLENTPIPDDMVDEVMEARRNFGESGNLNVYKPGVFFDVLFPIFSNRWLAELGSLITFGFTDWASRKLRNWLTDNDEKAVQAYRNLAGQHVSTMDSMPQGQSVLSIEEHAATVNPTTPPGGTRPHTPPGVGDIGGGGGAGAGDYGTSLAGAGGGLTGLGGAGGASGLGGIGGLSPGSASLAGAGGVGGVSLASGSAPGAGSAAGAIARGGGAGMGGLGMAGMGGLAGTGAAGGGTRSAGGRGLGGAGTGGAGRAGMGGMPMGGMGAGGAGGGRGVRGGGASGIGAAGAAGAGAGRGAGAGGRAGGAGGAGGGRAGMGMAGMGAGAGAGGDQATDHSTWLEEDEDVWGVDSDAAPPVLG
jgi:uncharacterized protein YukE